MKTRAELNAAIEEARAKLDAARIRGQELRAKETLTDAEDHDFDVVVRDINFYGADIVSLTAEAASLESAGSVSRAARGNALSLVEGAEEDYKSIGQRFAEVNGLKDIQRGQTIAMDVPGGSFHSRAIVNTPLLPASFVQPQRIEGFMRWEAPFQSLRDVLNVGQTNSDSLIYFRETAYTNSAVEVAEATLTTGATGLKPESAFTFDQQTSNVVTIAHWVPITKQTLWNAPELQSYIEGRLIDGLRYREDAELLNGNGVAPNMTGLLNTASIQVLDAAYFTANPVADTSTSNANFNRIRRAKRQVALVGRAMSNFVVLNPVNAEAFDTSTDAQRQYFGGGPLAAGIVKTIWGLRVVENENIASGTALVGDGRAATIWDRMAASVSAGWVNDDFIRNMVRLLAEERIGLTVFRPQAFAKVTLV